MDLKSRQIQKFKETEIGKIPIDWEIVSLDNLCIKITDGSHFSPKETESSKKRIASVKDIKDYDFDFRSCKQITGKDFDELVKNGCKPNDSDVIFSKDGTIGLTFVFKNNPNIVLLSSLAIIRTSEELNPHFLNYYLRNEKIQNFLVSGHSTGSALPRIVLRDLKKLPISLPAISEQHKINQILLGLDNIIKNLQKQNKVLEEIVHTIFKSWFIDFDGVTEFEDSELRKIPKGWNSTTLEEFIDYLVGFPFKSKEYHYGNDGIRLVRGDNVKQQKLVWGHKTRLWKRITPNLEKFLIKQNDILIGMDGSRVGKNFAFVYDYELPLLLVQRVARLRSKNEFCTELIWQFIKNDSFTNYIKTVQTGSAIPHISKEQILDFSVLSPSKNLIKKFHYVTKPIRRMISKNKYEITKLEEIRDILLPKLMSGEIRV